MCFLISGRQLKMSLFIYKTSKFVLNFTTHISFEMKDGSYYLQYNNDIGSN